jgi:hypothetical protein
VRAADMCLRASSQLRLWQKRKTIDDQESLNFVKSFLAEAAQGGSFLNGNSGSGCVSNLEPLTWTADVQFGSAVQLQNESSIDYESLSLFIERIRNTIENLQGERNIEKGTIDHAAGFIRNLGRHLGSMADERLRMPNSSYILPGERYSFQ